MNNKNGTNILFPTYKDIDIRLKNIFENNQTENSGTLEELMLKEFKVEMRDKYLGDYIVSEFVNFIGG